jgi:dipeptidyl aminopeptidase/acylaminoacyl peptidase
MFTILRRESPFYSVQRIRTPLLIMHGDDDRRTGFVQSEMLYRALKVLERPVEYVRYPNADHNLSRTGDPIQRMDRLNRIIEFFERFVENDRPAPQVSGQAD